MRRAGRPFIGLLIVAALAVAVSLLASTSPSFANHDGVVGDDDTPTTALIVDAGPTLARVHEPDVPDDCWTIQEFPYTLNAFHERKEECVDPWISVHAAFTFDVNEGGTYVVWQELLAPGMPAQLFPPTKQVFVESSGENRWLGFNSPLVDVENLTIGHLQSNVWVRDLEPLRRWGWDDEVHTDHRTPIEDGLRNRIAHVFTAKEDGTWRFLVSGTNPLPPGTREAGDNIRVWIQRLDGAPESTVLPNDRFNYPDADKLLIEHGATVYREFLILERDTNAPVSGVSVNLSPTGTCSSLDPGHMRCTINTEELSLGQQLFRFTSATRDGEPESVVDWPTFGFTTVPRDIRTKAEMTLDAKAKGQIVGGIFVTGESGLGIEFHENGSLTLDAGEAVALGVAADTGFGAGLKLGWITPRAKGEIEFEADIKAFEAVAIDINDPDDFDQQVAMSAFILDKLVSLGTLATIKPVDVMLDTFREDVLQQEFKPFVTADEFGVAASANLTGKLGSWTGNRPGLGALNIGMGGTAGGSISTSWKFDKKTGEHAIVAQISISGSGLFDPVTWPIYFEGQEINYSVLAGASAEITFTYDGNPLDRGQLQTVTVTIKGGTTWEERIDSGSVSITFDAQQFVDASDFLLENLIDLADEANTTEFSAEVLGNMLQAALEDVDGELVIKRSQGTRFRPTFELGAELLAGVGVSGEVEAGGDWRLVVTQKTQDWRLMVDPDGKRGLVQVAEFPFEETEESETPASDIVGELILEALQEHLPGKTFREWVREQWNSGEDVTIDASSEQTETALLDFSGDDRTVTNRLTGEVNALEIAVRTWFNVILPDWVIPGGRLDTSSDAQNFQVAFNSDGARQPVSSSFFASEFLDIAPAEITFDTPAEIRLSYLTDPSEPQQLMMYRYDANGVWQPLPTTIDADMKIAIAQITEFGTFVVGFDSTPPEILPIQTTTGFTAVVGDTGSGIDADAISAMVDGDPVGFSYDAATQTVSLLEQISDGSEIVLTVADTSGNETRYEEQFTDLPEGDTSNPGPNSGTVASGQPTSTPPVNFGDGGDGAPDEEGSGGGISPLIIVLIVLLVLAVGGGLFYFMRRQTPAQPA